MSKSKKEIDFETMLNNKSYDEWKNTPEAELPSNPTANKSPWMMGRNQKLIRPYQNATQPNANGDGFEASQAYKEVRAEIQLLNKLVKDLQTEFANVHDPNSALHGNGEKYTVERYFIDSDLVDYGNKPRLNMPQSHQLSSPSSLFKNVKSVRDISAEVSRLRGRERPDGTPSYDRSLLSYRQKYPRFVHDSILDTDKLLASATPQNRGEIIRDVNTYRNIDERIHVWQTQANRMRDIAGLIALLADKNGVEGVYENNPNTLTVHTSKLSPEQALDLAVNQLQPLLNAKEAALIDKGVEQKLARGYVLCSLPSADDGWYPGRHTEVPEIVETTENDKGSIRTFALQIEEPAESIKEKFKFLASSIEEPEDDGDTPEF